MKKVIFILANLVFGMTYSQGCSDAGFCTLANFKPMSTEEKPLENTIKAGISVGGADHNITIVSIYKEYNYKKDKYSFGAKATFLAQIGSEVQTGNIGDIYITNGYSFFKDFNATLGIKMPLTDGNLTKDKNILPLDHQSSLGTVDLILGASYKIKNVQVALGYQQPLSQNRNQFSSENIIGTFENYQTTRNYKRAGDVMLRVSYPFEFNKFKITPSVLPIYHLSNDLYTDATNVEREISGSQGLTVNGNVYFDYKLNNKNALQFNFGMPFVTRTARPDGLTRSWIATLEYAFSF
jgi:hypothetical protein